MKRQFSQGFTLIEVLIAMTLLGVMVVLLFSSLRLAGESWNAGENKVAEVNTKAVVYQFFKAHIAGIRPLPMLISEQEMMSESQQVFEGRLQSMRFVGALPAASARKGLQVFTLALEQHNPTRLLVHLKPYRVTEANADEHNDPPELLLDNIEQLRFAYFGKTEDVAEAQWREEWVVADRLPSLIKVTIELADGSYWPDMIFPLKITGAATPVDVNDTEGMTNESADLQ